jgi:hypothetical protein
VPTLTGTVVILLSISALGSVVGDDLLVISSKSAEASLTVPLV